MEAPKNQLSALLCLGVGTHRGLKIVNACFKPLKSVQCCFRGLILELLITYHYFTFEMKHSTIELASSLP